MSLDKLTSKMDQYLAKINVKPFVAELLKAIDDDNLQSVQKILNSKDLEDLQSASSLGLRQAIIFKAVKTDHDKRDILDALLTKTIFKESIKEVAYHSIMHTLYGFASDQTTFKTNKISSVLDHLSGELKFSNTPIIIESIDKKYDFALNKDNVIWVILRPAILSGVSISSLNKIFDNPTFKTLGFYKSHINYLSDLDTEVSIQINNDYKTVTEGYRPGQEGLLDKIASVYRELFNEEPGFIDQRFDLNATKIDYTIPERGVIEIGVNTNTTIPATQPDATKTSEDTNSAIPTTTQPDATKTSEDTNPAIPTTTQPDATKANEDTNPAIPTTTQPVTDENQGAKNQELTTNLSVADYVNNFRKINPVDLNHVMPEVYTNIRDRKYEKDLMKDSLKTALVDIKDKELVDSFLVAASVQREILITKKKKDQQYTYQDDFINKKVEHKCISGEHVIKGQPTKLKAEINFNSSPQLAWSLVKSDSEVQGICNIYKSENLNDMDKAVNNYFDYALQYTLVYNPDVFDNLN
jgi:hypothetical protein